MGTNYYQVVGGERHCATCECFERLHIGKSSGGWAFGVEVHPEVGINSLEDWQKGLTGAKPERFCRWVLELLNVQEGDELIDLFTGTGIMGHVAAEVVGISGQMMLDGTN